MKKSNIFLSVVLAAVLVVCLSSCDTIADTSTGPIPDSTFSAPFLGTYSHTYNYYVDSWTFNNDGTGKYVRNYTNSYYSDYTDSFTYTYNSDEILLTYSGGDTSYLYYIMSDSNNTLTLEHYGIYKK